MNKKFIPKLVAGIIVGAIIGSSGYSFARTHYYYYDNGSGGSFKTPTWYPDALAAYLGIVGGPIPVKDVFRLSSKMDEFKKTVEIVQTAQQIAKNTQELFKLVTGKDIGLDGKVFSDATNVLNRASGISKDSLFHASKKVEGTDLILNTRLTYAGLKDPATITKYKNDLFNENARINQEAQKELTRLTGELEILQTAIMNVIEEKGAYEMTDSERKAAINALKDKKKALESEINNTAFMQNAKVNDSFIKGSANIVSLTKMLQDTTSAKHRDTSDFEKNNKDYIKQMNEYGDARGRELEIQNQYNYEKSGIKIGEYVDDGYQSLDKLQAEYAELIKNGPYYYQYYDDDGYSYYYYRERRLRELIEQKNNVLNNLQNQINSAKSLADNKQSEVNAINQDSLRKDQSTQSSYLNQTSSFETNNAWLGVLRDNYDPSKMSEDEQQKLLSRVQGTGIVGSDIADKEIQAREKQVSTLSESAEQKEYKDKLQQSREIDNQIKALENNEDISTKKELQKGILIDALSAKIEALEKEVDMVKEKREMYQKAMQERIKDMEDIKARSNAASMTTRDPWNQDTQDAKEHPTRKGFGWKAF